MALQIMKEKINICITIMYARDLSTLRMISAQKKKKNYIHESYKRIAKYNALQLAKLKEHISINNILNNNRKGSIKVNRVIIFLYTPLFRWSVNLNQIMKIYAK